MDSGGITLVSHPGRVEVKLVGEVSVVAWEMSADNAEALAAALLEKAHWARRMTEMGDGDDSF